MKKFITLLLTLTTTQFLAAQSNTSEDFMRSMGKIYVVVAVIVVVFIGITIFLIYLDRKLTKLEHQIKDNDQA
jgi:CcmD family protein